MKRRLLTCVVVAGALALAAACHVELIGDLVVYWDIDGDDSVSLCSTYGIERWKVEARGPDIVEIDYACSEPWDSGTAMYNVAEGTYTVTVEAIEAGTSNVLATKTRTVRVVGREDAYVSFSASDFVPEPQGKLDVYWNINGTVDGQATSESWDKCDEVGAESAEIEVNGEFTTVACGGNMSTTIDVADTPTAVTVRLLDSSGDPLTTWTPETPGPSLVSGETDHWEYVGEFYYDAFTDTFNGDYLFQVSYEGKSCHETTPAVVNQVTLLKLDGSPVTADVCGPDSQCVATDGASFGQCYGKDQTQDISNIEWGAYALKLSGTLGPSQGYDICWEKEFDILTGAGTVNPVALHDLPFVATSGACVQ